MPNLKAVLLAKKARSIAKKLDRASDPNPEAELEAMALLREIADHLDPPVS